MAETKKIEEAIKKSKEIVEKMNLEEPYKSLTYQKLLDKFLVEKEVEKKILGKEKFENIDIDSLEKISKRLEISIEEVKNTVQTEKDSIIIIKKLSGLSRKEIQTKGILIASFSLKFGLEQQINSEDLTEICKNSGIDIEHIENAFTFLQDKRFLVSHKKGSKIKILTPHGEKEAKKIFEEQ